jgi:hypothetical protein
LIEKERSSFLNNRRRDMRNMARLGWHVWLAALMTLGLASCGGNESLPSKTTITKVYVMGDSLADVGTFGGVKFTFTR